MQVVERPEYGDLLAIVCLSNPDLFITVSVFRCCRNQWLLRKIIEGFPSNGAVSKQDGIFRPTALCFSYAEVLLNLFKSGCIIAKNNRKCFCALGYTTGFCNPWFLAARRELTALGPRNAHRRKAPSPPKNHTPRGRKTHTHIQTNTVSCITPLVD